MKRRVLAIMLAGAMAASMAACGSKAEEKTESAAASSAAEETEEAAETAEEAPAEEAEAEDVDSEVAVIQEKGTLVVGITDFAPMDYKDADGNWVGFDADMAAAFAESLGVNVEFLEIDWDNKILELDSGAIDCVWNGMTLTDEVMSAMECTEAYLNNAQIVIVKAEDADKYQDVDSLKELNFAVESGSAGAAVAEENGLNYTEVQNQAGALMEIASGTADAAIIDSLMAAAMVGEGTSYADLTYTVALSEEEYGVGFRKGSDLAAALNDYFKAAMEEGIMDQIAEEYGVQAALIK
ncbi:MAG: transporter substrate-binding domain-containing protein [Lachnospiraceae bacterium]|nr:transporter substrate-binding domain-containing protein [Lachnospiraceae bacterium]